MANSLRNRRFRFSLRTLLMLVAVSAILCFCASWILDRRAPDSWAYSRFTVNNEHSTFFYTDLRGVGNRPTAARIVRIEHGGEIPVDFAKIPSGALSELASRMRNKDRWASDLTLIAGRSNDERIEIRINSPMAEEWFSRPGSHFENYVNCESFWNEFVAPRLPPLPSADEKD